MPMGCVSIPFRRLPHQPKLFVRLIDDYSSVRQFYAHPPNMDAVREVASRLDYPAERRSEVARILREQNAAFGASAATTSNLEKLERGAVAVVSGQQVGLFGGPAYAIYKALTAIRLAEELSEAGVPAVPIFWMATEDHDLDEVRHVTWFDSGKLVKFELPPSEGPGRPVGNVRLGAAIEEKVKQAVALLSGPASETLSRILEQSYEPKETYGSAFGKLFAHLFAGQGLILLDPLDARLHRIAAPLYKKAIEDRDELNDKLLQKYGLCIENLWAGPQELRRKMESVSVPEALAQGFDRDKTEMERTLAELGAQIEKLDSTLAGAVSTARNKIGFQLEKLRRKTGRALDQKSGLLAEHERFLENLLYPGKQLQFREVCFLPFLGRVGT